MEIRLASIADAHAIAEIYNYYIQMSHATFETEPLDDSEMSRRINETFSSNYPFLVCEIENEIAGYAYGRRYRPRAAYQHSIEISVYVRPDFENRRVGTRLYERLIPEIVGLGFHAIIAGVSLPNDASVKLHEKFGFEKVAHFREVGFKFGRWIDVGYWQIIRNH